MPAIAFNNPTKFARRFSGIRMPPRTSENRRKVYIAVMGVTGAGKSTFIRTASGIDAIEIGHNLKSCTTDVFPYQFSYGDYDVTLIDTPGFNDTLRSETEVLREIADWLDYTYRNPPNVKLTGIIYMQAATDRRMFGSTLRNLKMFRELCGDEPLKNVVLATTCWGVAERSGEMEKAVDNEEQLRTDPLFWQPMLKRGSEMVRFEDTKESALSIIQKLVDKRPVVLQIQHELVDQEKDLINTTAGATVNEEIKKLEERYKKDIADVQAEMRDALENRDQELQEVLSESKANLEKLREGNRRAQDMLEYDRRNRDRKHDNEMQSLKMELEITKTQSAERDSASIRREMQFQAEAQRLEDKLHFEGIVAQIRANAEKVRYEERQAMETRIQELEGQKQKSGTGKKLLLSLVPTIGKVALAALGFPLGLSPFSGFMEELNGDLSISGGAQMFNGQYTGYFQEDEYSLDTEVAVDWEQPPSYTDYEVEEME